MQNTGRFIFYSLGVTTIHPSITRTVKLIKTPLLKSQHRVSYIRFFLYVVSTETNQTAMLKVPHRTRATPSLHNVERKTIIVVFPTLLVVE